MTAEQVGVQFFYIGIIAVVVQGFLIRPLTRIFTEEKIFMAGNIIMVIGLGAIPFATSTFTLALFFGLMAFGKSLNTPRSEEHTSELQSRGHLVCRLLLAQTKPTA